jgi:hypothetical protein
MASLFAGPKNTWLFSVGLFGKYSVKYLPYRLKCTQTICEEIAQISEGTLQDVMRSFLTRVHLCIEEGGGQLKDIVHKKWNYVQKKS